jgi:hypothetical protein
MMLKALFDEKRRKEIRERVKTGRPIEFRKRPREFSIEPILDKITKTTGVSTDGVLQMIAKASADAISREFPDMSNETKTAIIEGQLKKLIEIPASEGLG